MPRIYKPVGPSNNKAENGPTSTKSPAPTQADKVTEEGKKKGNSGEK